MPHHSDVARVPPRLSAHGAALLALHCTPAARRRSSRRRTTIPVEIIAIQQYKHPGFSSHGQVLHDHKESYCYYVELGEYSGKCTNFTEANGSGIHGYRLVQESKRCDDRAAAGAAAAVAA